MTYTPYNKIKSFILADIAWVKEILSKLDRDDIITKMSFESRLEEVEKELEELENEHRKSYTKHDERKGRM